MSQTCKEPIIKSSRWFDRSGIHALILMAVIIMIPLLLSVPAYETRLGPFLHQEGPENLFQGHLSLLHFHNWPSFQHTSNGAALVLLSGHPWGPHCLNGTLCQGDTSHWGWDSGAEVGECVARGWAQSPQGPMAHTLPTSPDSVYIRMSKQLLSQRQKGKRSPLKRREEIHFEQSFFCVFCFVFYSAHIYLPHTSSAMIFEI